jgi:DNA invertase Pin-like site-specific DNA recombinase
MSTEDQIYSTENQAIAIASYAALRNIDIVRSYIDKARSGISLSRRRALRELINDVKAGQADYQIILVYDVSRWGRFQDADESAYYEFICKQAGIRVTYCAEEFENDNGLASTIAKNVKRAFAADFSRQLSRKVFAAQIRLVSLGFRQGGPPAYGLRRELFDQAGQSRGLLKQGQRKAIQSDRVLLKAGPVEEQELVRRIFRDFVIERKCESRIARDLRNEGITNQYGRPWTSWSIRYLLRNEHYIGNNIYNRANFRLGQNRKENPPHLWVRSRATFDPIVDPSLFALAQKRIARRRLVFSNSQMIEGLKKLLKEKGMLSRTLIDKADDLPSHTVYIKRFGNLREAYAPETLKYHDGRKGVIVTLVEFRSELVDALEAAGVAVALNSETGVLTLKGTTTVSIAIARCHLQRDRFPRWAIGRPVDQTVNRVVVVRMDEANDAVLDYFLLRPKKLRGVSLLLGERNPANVLAYRHETFDEMIDALMRAKP